VKVTSASNRTISVAFIAIVHLLPGVLAGLLPFFCCTVAPAVHYCCRVLPWRLGDLFASGRLFSRCARFSRCCVRPQPAGTTRTTRRWASALLLGPRRCRRSSPHALHVLPRGPHRAFLPACWTFHIEQRLLRPLLVPDHSVVYACLLCLLVSATYRVRSGSVRDVTLVSVIDVVLRRFVLPCLVPAAAFKPFC